MLHPYCSVSMHYLLRINTDFTHLRGVLFRAAYFNSVFKQFTRLLFYRGRIRIQETEYLDFSSILATH